MAEGVLSNTFTESKAKTSLYLTLHKGPGVCVCLCVRVHVCYGYETLLTPKKY